MPLSTPPSGLRASATVTLPLEVVAGLPKASSTATVSPKLLPAVMVAGGCVVTASSAAAPV